MALGLLELGHEVRLFGKRDRRGTWSGCDLSGAGALPGLLQTAGFAVSNLTAVARQRPDHVISAHVNFSPATHLAKRLFGSPYSLVAHGIDIHAALPAKTLAALRASDRIIAVSSWTRDRVLALGGIEPENVAILPNTVDESRFTVGARPDALRKGYGIGPDEKVLLTVARLDDRERYKGYDRMIEALPMIQRECGSVRFVIVGAGNDETRVVALANRLGVAGSVILAGFVDAERLADYYRLADVFVMPSTGEGFGIVFLESMACGTPVIAGNRDGSVDALDAGRLGKLIDPMSVEAIAAAVCDMLCRRGPDLWFDRVALHDAAVGKFGRKAFRERLREALPF